MWKEEIQKSKRQKCGVSQINLPRCLLLANEVKLGINLTLWQIWVGRKTVWERIRERPWGRLDYQSFGHNDADLATEPAYVKLKLIVWDDSQKADKVFNSNKSVLRYLWLDFSQLCLRLLVEAQNKQNPQLEMEQVVQGLLRQNRRQTWAFDQCLVEQNIAVLDGPFCQIDNFEKLDCQAFWFSFSLSTMST